ncbi:hypothetical protein [Williamsoniiplasma lucivorax]|uniref:Uncharacterized protein n=1 Tax=Williamsoniiplasma lucivorax TaxID=209274 RepID=A0A2S5RET8_9MOLU|nr:hypothetical protein [Williamsoniiplasma lucivorax]PPE05807.1 hypothetical protein ELUCI_v1c00950 [Williamsoniiplasma lucivorax]
MLAIMNQNQIIGLSLLVIGILITLIFIGLFFWIKKQTERMSNFRINNQESKSVWEFTKKNFPLVLIVFGIMLVVAGISMLAK